MRGKRWTGAGIAGALAVLTAAALYLRFTRLGALSLFADEGFTCLAVRGILERSVPVLPSGFVYWKSLLYSWVAAAPVRVLGETEFSLRFSAAFLSA